MKATILWILYLVECVFVFFLVILSKRKNKTLQSRKKEFDNLTEQLNKSQQELSDLQRSIIMANALLDDTNHSAEIANEKRNSILQLIQVEEQRLKEQKENAAEIAKQQMDLEVEKLRVELEEKLKEIQQNSPLAAYQKELADAQKRIEILHQQQAQELEKEDFYAAHSIEISEADQQDIQLLSELSKKLVHRDILNKLIWSEYVQKPIQNLCKSLNTEKLCGIYKITNKNNSMAYIGQAVDIADRWKTHCKSALGIGSLAYLTNKFYKAMHKEGINNFSFEVLEACSKEELDEKELYYINFYETVQYGYNTKHGN